MDTKRKIVFLLAISMLPFSHFFCGQANEHIYADSKPELSIHLSVGKLIFRVGDPIRLKVEITNTGKIPILVANDVALTAAGASWLELQLKNSRGQLSPKTEMIVDTLVSQRDNSCAHAFLNSWLLLRPGNSFASTILLDESILTFLGQPGTYRLSGIYSSSGFSYPPKYQQLGLSDEDVKSAPFAAWNGKLQTNEVSFKSEPGRKNN